MLNTNYLLNTMQFRYLATKYIAILGLTNSLCGVITSIMKRFRISAGTILWHNRMLFLYAAWISKYDPHDNLF